eukprot:CAMPEP_0182442638 /NCGR_PEP_ID=MMETSP1172-20130603/1550_1 /TAXON_ID=708627 /ORGANISM="Timspurckia oligopyrenoides, Strain CCMP3278" /LENGTH=263 /DNA_ID=CAMNT_0024637613 /DNA_START=1 /DNA_END=789 /DNA_ORIENTATION=+
MKRDYELDEVRDARKRKREAAAESYRALIASDANPSAPQESVPGSIKDSEKEMPSQKTDTIAARDAVQQKPYAVRNIPDPFKVIVLLDSANLETVKVGKEGGYQLLNQDDHQSILARHRRDPAEARPDITHQCLLALMDSPLNKAGKLKVYIRTRKNVLIDIHPDTRIPRTMKRFSGLMVELLQKLKIRATNSPHPLLKVIRNPITSHLPVGCRKVLMTYNCDNLVDLQEHAQNIGIASTTHDASSVLYVVGAFAHGKVDADW